MAYWKRASDWAWANAKSFVALHRALYRLTVSLAGVGLGWSLFGVGKPKDMIFVALCALAANVLAVPAVYLFNLFLRAPVALDAARDSEEVVLREAVYKHSGYARAIGGIERREDDLRRIWIPDFFRGTLQPRAWLTQVVTEGHDYRDYVDPLKQWAERAPDEIRITREDPTSGDVEFKIRQKWFDV